MKTEARIDRYLVGLTFRVLELLRDAQPSSASGVIRRGGVCTVPCLCIDTWTGHTRSAERDGPGAVRYYGP